MSEYKNPISVTSQFSFCGLPFRLDTYSGCSFNCTYCFARLRGGYQHDKKLKAANPNKIITRFKNALKNDQQGSIISEYIRHKMPLHFGGMSDPFQPIEKEYKVTLKVLKYLCDIQYPIVISTKSTLLSNPRYLEILSSNPKLITQFSLSTLSDAKSEIAEPFSTKPSDILKTIEILSKNNIHTTVRWQPYIPHFSESPKSFISTISKTGIKHLSFEHLKLPVEINNPLWKRLVDKVNFDIRTYYFNNGAKIDGREWVLPSEYKLSNILLLKSHIDQYDITLGIADNELQYLSDSDCCCSGVDLFDGFENWNKYQIGFAIRKSINEDICYSSIKNEWKPTGSIDQHLNSESRIKKRSGSHNDVSDYIKERWQNINSYFNPTKYHGIEFRNDYDQDGMKIYKWKN